SPRRERAGWSLALLRPGGRAERERRLQQLVLGVDRVLARGPRHLVRRGQRERARRTRLHAETAHDAAQVVDLVVLRVPLAGRDAMLLGVLRALDVDRVGRTRERAELAADALLQAVLVLVEQMAADVRSRRRLHDPLRVLLGDVAAEGLLERHAEAAREASEDAAAGLRLRGRGARGRLGLPPRLVAHRCSPAGTGPLANSG